MMTVADKFSVAFAIFMITFGISMAACTRTKAASAPIPEVTPELICNNLRIELANQQIAMLQCLTADSYCRATVKDYKDLEELKRAVSECPK